MIIKTSYPFMKPPPSARLIRGHRLAQGLIGCWLFNEDDGSQVFDLSRNENYGTLVDVSWAFGKYGSGIYFPGISGDNIQLAKTLTLSDFTIIYSGLNGDNTGSTLMGHQNDGINYVAIRNDNDDIAVETQTNGNTVYVCNGVVFDGEQASYAITKKGTLVSGYKNGVFIDSDTLAIDEAILISAIGQGFWASDHDGTMDYIYLYNRDLFASEITQVTWNPFCMLERKARTALISGYAVPPVGMAGAMTTNSGYWGW